MRTGRLSFLLFLIGCLVAVVLGVSEETTSTGHQLADEDDDESEYK